MTTAQLELLATLPVDPFSMVYSEPLDRGRIYNQCSLDFRQREAAEAALRMVLAGRTGDGAMSDLARSSSDLALPHTATEIDLTLPEGMSVEEWQKTGETLSGIDRACKWWIGDWLQYGEREYGERYDAAAAVTGYSKQTLMDAVWVARKVPKSLRVKRLSFGHHKAVAKLEPAEQKHHLADAARNRWSVAELRERIKESTEGDSPSQSPRRPSRSPANWANARRRLLTGEMLSLKVAFPSQGTLRPARYRTTLGLQGSRVLHVAHTTPRASLPYFPTSRRQFTAPTSKQRKRGTPPLRSWPSWRPGRPS